jgi:hypothetical protein
MADALLAEPFSDCWQTQLYFDFSSLSISGTPIAVSTNTKPCWFYFFIRESKTIGLRFTRKPCFVAWELHEIFPQPLKSRFHGINKRPTLFGEKQCAKKMST